MIGLLISFPPSGGVLVQGLDPLGLTVLYNVSQAHGFVQYPLEGAD